MLLRLMSHTPGHDEAVKDFKAVRTVAPVVTTEDGPDDDDDSDLCGSQVDSYGYAVGSRKTSAEELAAF